MTFASAFDENFHLVANYTPSEWEQIKQSTHTIAKLSFEDISLLPDKSYHGGDNYDSIYLMLQYPIAMRASAVKYDTKIIPIIFCDYVLKHEKPIVNSISPSLFSISLLTSPNAPMSHALYAATLKTNPVIYGVCGNLSVARALISVDALADIP